MPAHELPLPTPPLGRSRLTVGMAVYDDFDGAYFTIQALRVYHGEVMDEVEILLVDNHPEGQTAQALKSLDNAIPNYRHIPFRSFRSFFVKDVVFREASGDFVLCVDAHALLKGAIVVIFGLATLGQAGYKAWVPNTPSFQAMGIMGIAALVANATCLGLLWHHRSDDINMHSVWVCSRNDILAKVSVLVAAGFVWFWRTGWPDTIIGCVLAVFVLRSAFRVVRRARVELVSCLGSSVCTENADAPVGLGATSDAYRAVRERGATTPGGMQRRLNATEFSKQETRHRHLGTVASTSEIRKGQTWASDDIT